MTELPDNRDNYCYRHPSRQSFVLCQRCGRTICPACQTQASVGVHCPECVKEAKKNAPRAVKAARSYQSRSGRPMVTYSLIAVSLVVFVLQSVTGNVITNALLYYAPFTVIKPWTIITSMFAHASIMHVAFNMFSLYILGTMLEPALGRARFLALYFISGLGGTAAVILLTPATPVLGASGAIFGLLGALFIIVRRTGGNTTQLVIVLGINVVIGFVVPNIAWQAHLGGLLVGVAIAAVYVRTRSAAKSRLQFGLIVGILAIVVAAGAVRFLL